VGATPTPAVYWDFENIPASLVDERWGEGAYQQRRSTVLDVLIDVPAVMSSPRPSGWVAINRAYANWWSLARNRPTRQDVRAVA